VGLVGLPSAKLWNSFIRDPQIVQTYFVLSDAVNLYREALLCYDARAHMAACICARSSMEAALHAARRTRNLNAPQVHGPKSARVNLRDTKWIGLLRWASTIGLLDKNLKGRVKRARKLGDLGAHLAQRRARAHKQQMKIIEKRPELQPWSIEIWPTRGDALNSLFTCRDLIHRIAAQRWEQK
jgi:hypothetical protein